MARLRVKKLKPVFSDRRGTITDILEGAVKHTGIIYCYKGAERGSHFHKKSTQYVYVLKGRMEMKTKDLAMAKSRTKTALIEEGDFVTIAPKVAHSFRALEETSFLDLTTESRARGGYEKDTVRLEF